MKTKSWVILVAALLLVSLALCFLLPWRGAAGTVARVYKDGTCIRSVDLSAVTEGYTFAVADEAGENMVEVAPGRIRVCSADCPDQVCVSAGWLSDSAAPIVCLPHRLVIRIEKNAAAESSSVPDTVSR